MSSLSSWDLARIRDWEDRFLEPDEPDDRDEYENDLWLRADDDAEERWVERSLHDK